MFFDKTFISNLLKCQQCEQQYDDYDQVNIKEPANEVIFFFLFH